MAELRDGMTYHAFQADLAMLEMAPRIIRGVESDDEAQAQADIAREIIRRHSPRLDRWAPSIPAALLHRAIARPTARFVAALAQLRIPFSRPGH